MPFEVFINIGRGGMHTMADAEAIGRLISMSLRLARAAGSDPKAVAQKIASQLRGIGGASHVGFGKDRVMSLADAVAKVLSEDMALGSASPVSETESATAEPLPLNLTEEKSAPAVSTGVDDVVGAPIFSAPSDPSKVTADLCPECGQATFVYEEGCKKCYSCGYSMC
jgi:ribonucleoside-diphosphate reductase alpha chain